MIRIAIVDDEKVFADDYCRELCKLFKKHEVKCEIDTYTDARFFQGMLREKKYELIFLDIDMPDITGIDLAKEIRKSDSETTIVFVSYHENFVFEAYRYTAYRFIRKNLLQSDTEEMVETFCRNHNEKSYIMTFDLDCRKKADENLFLIWYFYAARHDIFYVKENKESIHLNMHAYTLDFLEEELKDHGYIRVHRSYLVNCEYIYELKSDCVILKDGQSLAMSRGRIEAVKQVYQKRLRRKGKL